MNGWLAGQVPHNSTRIIIVIPSTDEKGLMGEEGLLRTTTTTKESVYGKLCDELADAPRLMAISEQQQQQRVHNTAVILAFKFGNGMGKNKNYDEMATG